MASVRKTIEGNILQELRLRLGDSATVQGFLESVETGRIKERVASGPEVRVVVSSGQSEGWMSPFTVYSATVSVRLDLEDDPTLSVFDALCEKVEGFIEECCAAKNHVTLSGVFTVPGFRADMFRADSGSDDMSFSPDDPYVSTTFAFSVRGVSTPK